MRISHDHRNCFPPPKLLHGVDVAPGLHESSGKGMTQIMKPESFHICPSHGGIKDTQEIPRIHSIPGPVEEDIIRLERSDFRPGFEDLQRLGIHGKRISASVLLFQQRNGSPEQVHVAPLEVQNFTLPQSRVRSEKNDLL